MITIDGTTYDVGVVSLKRTGEFLEKYAERTEDGVLHRELIGVYFHYQLNLGWSVENPDSYDALWKKLTEPQEFHTVTVPDGSRGSFTFTAYFSGVGDDLFLGRDDNHYWRNLSVSFTAMAPARA